MKTISFAVDPTAPPLVQAASLALALLRVSKSVTWADLVADPGRLDGVTVPVEHVALLNEHSGALTGLQVGPPLVTIAVCPVCGLHTLISGTPATTCPMTLGCAGKPVRASVATRAKD